MGLACEHDITVRFFRAYRPELDFVQSGIPPGAQVLDFLGPLGIAGAYPM
jgi:hypothetical protein